MKEPSTLSPAQAFQQGAQATIPMIIGAIPFGILFGALAVSNGLSGWAALSMSLLVFAGSSQFVAATLVGQDTGLLVIIGTTFVVNIRHALYAASLGSTLAPNTPQRVIVPMAFWLTDETYATVIHHNSQDAPLRLSFYFGSAVAMYVNWQLCTMVGIFLGHQLQSVADWGLEFAMLATFIGIVIPKLTNWPMLAAALSSAVTAVVCQTLPHNLGLIVAALAGISCGVLCENIKNSEQALA